MRFFSLCCLKNSLALLCILWSNCLFAQKQDIPTLKKQLSLATTDSSRSQILYDLGKQYELANFDSTFYFMNQSLQAAQKCNNQRAIAQAMFGMGYTCIYYTKDETKAMQWLNKALTVAKKSNDNLNMARCYQFMCVIAIHQNIGNPYELQTMALNAAKKANNWNVLVESYEIMTDYLIIKKKYKEAEKMTLAALEISQQHDIDIWFAHGLGYAELLKDQNKHTEAQLIYTKLNLFKNKLKKSKGYFVYMNDLGNLETNLKNYDQAESIFLKILEYERSQSKVDSFHVFHIFRSLKNLYVEQGSFKKAYQVSEDLAEVRLWLAQKRQTQDSRLQMTQLKSGLDLEKKDVEISLLETQKKQQQLFLIAAILIALLLVSFMVFLQRNKQRIEQQRAELGQLNTTKDKLFAILSHDLRSPVASLKNYMMLINWGALSQTEFTESAQGLNTQVSNVHTMLENVLNWSISQMGGMKPKIEKIAISAIIDEQIQLLKPIAEAKNISIENNIPSGVDLLADKNHLMIIFRNLLQNALKFTNLGGNISFNYTENGTIEVKDNGIGMSEKQLANLFQLEKNTSSIGTDNEHGTGLGLVLVKELVEINKGKIVVRSELEKGTTFNVILPKE